MKSNFFRIVSFAVAVAFLMPSMTNAQTGKTSFAGNWAFNPEKSDLGQGGGQRTPGNMAVKQESNLLTVERTRTGQDGQPMTTTEKYTLDGKESVNTSARGESKSIVKWADDGKSLDVVTTRTVNMNGETREIKTTSVWTLTDANTLTVTSTSATPNGDRVTKIVYDKK